MSRRLRKIIAPLVAILGVQGWLLVLHGDWGRNSQFKLLLVAAGVGSVTPLSRQIWRVLRRLRRPAPKVRAAIGIGVTIAAAAVFGRFAIASHRDLFPTMHDEFQFLLQARMAAAGRLWMPAHELANFFDTFYVLVQPKYAAQSFPGTAIFYAPAIGLHVAPWKWAVGLAALTAGMFYRVSAELIDGLAGLLAAALLVELSLMRYVSTMVLAQMPVMLLGLVTIWAYLHWRRTRRAVWAVAVGFAGGWMAITRPADALVLGLAVGIGFLLDTWRKPAALAAVAMGCIPWLIVQLVFNAGVTGHWLTTPFALYNQRDQPGLAYGLHPSVVIGAAIGAAARPVTQLPEKRRYYRESVRPFFAAQTPGGMWNAFKSVRLPVAMAADLPQPLLLALVPLGVLAWGRKRAWLAAAGVPLFFLIYAPYPLFATHYCIVAAPALILTALLAPKALALAWRGSRAGMWTGLTIFTVGIVCTGGVAGYPMQSAAAFHSRVLKSADEKQAELMKLGRPAVILFRRDRALSLEAEPVYNLQAAWPDDELVIRAHDRDGENGKIFRYYSTHGADRAFYRFDESRPDDPLTFLGMASELARRSGGH